MSVLRYGWAGKILRVDLGKGEIMEIPTSAYAPKFIGGRAMGAKIYWDEVASDIGAFDPRNRLIFTTGPAVGTLAPSANRVFVTAKSPVPYPVECYFFCSLGGHWGPELKFAGFDGLIIQGKAPAPVYVWINDGHGGNQGCTAPLGHDLPGGTEGNPGDPRRCSPVSRHWAGG